MSRGPISMRSSPRSRPAECRERLARGDIAAVIHQDPGHLVRSAVRILKAKCDNRATLASQERIRIEILIAENL
jgi:LacI family transcriptional regulator